MSNVHLVDGNRLTLLQNGGAYFPQLCADIDACRSFVYLETYIFANDATARQICDALLRAAGRDVVVRVLMDGFGSVDFPKPWLAELTDAGVQVQWFRREFQDAPPPLAPSASQAGGAGRRSGVCRRHQHHRRYHP
jgi:cardiolipin synthase